MTTQPRSQLDVYVEWATNWQKGRSGFWFTLIDEFKEPARGDLARTLKRDTPLNEVRGMIALAMTMEAVSEVQWVEGTVNASQS